MLKRSIRALTATDSSARPEAVLKDVLVDLEELRAAGCWWHVGVLERWIPRFQGAEG